MDLAAVFLLSLVGGYAFASLWRYTAYETRRTEGHHLYFRAAFFGVLFFVAAYLLRIAALAYWPTYGRLDAALLALVDPALKDSHDARQNALFVTAAYSMLLGPTLAALLNLLTPKHWGLERSLSTLDDLLLRAQRAEMPVSVTLLTGKVYVGVTVRITDPHRPPPSIVLFPMLSGYRDATGHLHITTDYERVYGALANNADMRAKLKLPAQWQPNFHIVLRADQIVSATMFSPAVFSEFNPGWRESIDALPTQPQRQELVVEIKEPAKKPWKR